MALRARIYAYNRHLSFDVSFICSTLTHCGVCHLSVWRLKWEVSYVHQRVWRWKWFSCQSSYVLQRLRLCRTSDTVFRREIDSQRQWGYGTCYGDSFPAAKECIIWCERDAKGFYSLRLTQFFLFLCLSVCTIIAHTGMCWWLWPCHDWGFFYKVEVYWVISERDAWGSEFFRAHSLISVCTKNTFMQ